MSKSPKKQKDITNKKDEKLEQNLTSTELHELAEIKAFLTYIDIKFINFLQHTKSNKGNLLDVVVKRFVSKLKTDNFIRIMGAIVLFILSIGLSVGLILGAYKSPAVFSITASVCICIVVNLLKNYKKDK